jgi:uncharacterized membrane protein
MRNFIFKSRRFDPRIQYRGIETSRLDNLTDAVFGIAITLLIFNLTNPNSFEDLIRFTKTLPAFLIGIAFLIIVWKEHVRFSEVYGFDDMHLVVLNTLFIALIIFYVYPLRFLTLFLTSLLFQTDLPVAIRYDQVPDLMIYYGFVAFALYFTLYLMVRRAFALREVLRLNAFEIYYTRAQKTRLAIMFGVPAISILITVIINQFSFIWAATLGGITYCLYSPLMILWARRYDKKAKKFLVEQQTDLRETEANLLL